MTRLPETFLEVVRQEGVEHGVDGGVGVLETVREEDDDHERVALVKPGILSETGSNK